MINSYLFTRKYDIQTNRLIIGRKYMPSFLIISNLAIEDHSYDKQRHAKKILFDYFERYSDENIEKDEKQTSQSLTRVSFRKNGRKNYKYIYK
ncbi:hypothetical protein BpHYR1_006558 [Brachionus plicatilis]|uniref:Uncharacterized protein n=1 Tax=Brachionus plicatilis TaxID=10195 RepID=A0A3M7SZ79_BRAPC|nr:hypothetical protein BpHYR1_006558 [Brachionus plicatilis]